MLLVAVSCAFCALFAAILLAKFSGPREPTYKGRPLKAWVKGASFDYRSALRGDYRPPARKEAICAMGTNATPFLLKWIQYDTPRWKVATYGALNWLRAAFKKQPAQDSGLEFANDAALALVLLRDKDPQLVPHCIKLGFFPSNAPPKAQSRARSICVVISREEGVPVSTMVNAYYSTNGIRMH